MKYDGENLQEVLEAHRRYVYEEEGWAEDDLADFSRAFLRGAFFRKVNLRGANLSRADLIGANLCRTNLISANLTEANMSRAILTKADLRFAKLSGTILQDANMGSADLRDANLSGADLSGSCLVKADLRGANLCGVNLSGTDLKGASMEGADLKGAKNVPFVPMACPDDGAFIGWKKCLLIDRSREDEPICYGIIKLLIPEDAARSSATTRKCRASCATVLEIQTVNGVSVSDIPYAMDMDIAAVSKHDSNFEYIIGETVCPTEPFDADRWNECGSGIHFFINRQEAVNYQW